MSDWFLYILECNDGSLYTGITNDLEKRLSDHEAGTGAKYTRGRGPLQLVYSEPFKNRSEASIREAQIKKLSRKEKQQLINPGH
ncbi:MAG: GIY-YIG nuclease family protein [Alphaproteobacteria bacterium]|nr:GIY-YIG nuclease family protein [Alphaproteobacteria bacterium]HPF47251.1 GIY-YIG nuclease family protein [Emcibacteraceae bacterium]HRW29625.1 GIY-YIG nuclease family protein [Emcibacteraceae bacterium]